MRRDPRGMPREDLVANRIEREPITKEQEARSPSSAGDCQVCGRNSEKRYGGLGRYVAMCGDCWDAIDEVRLTAAEAAVVHKLIMFVDAEDVPEFSEPEIAVIWALSPRLEHHDQSS